MEKKSEFHHTSAIKNFQRSLTRREVKCPYFIFDMVKKKWSTKSLFGTEANLVTADRDEFGPCATTVLFNGV